MLRESEYLKIRITVPKESAEKIVQTLGEVGAGQVGNYSHCSFQYPVSGTFKPNEQARPAVGQAGTLEHVEEVMVEAICHKDKIEEVYQAVVAIHPYEEPAIDIMPRLEIN